MAGMKGTRASLAAGLLAVGVSEAAAQCPAGTWVTLASMNEPRQELGVAELDGKIYAVAGLAGRGNANEIYEVATNTWSLGANLPIVTDHPWAVALGGRVYVGGGTTNRVFRYDPGADQWTEVASSFYVHGGTPAAAVIDGKIYVAGGNGGGMAGNEVESYDPVTNQWTIRASMFCARNHTAGGVIGGKLYVAGGRPGNQTCHEVYDPATNLWDLRASLPTGRSGVAGAVVGDCFYVFGGEGNFADPAGIFHNVEAYSPATNSWTILPAMRVGRHGIYAAVIGNQIYLPGGATVAGFGVTGIHDAYLVPVAPGETPPRAPVILAPRRDRTPRD
jgi:N-acetylneuraminic acid mutarotase